MNPLLNRRNMLKATGSTAAAAAAVAALPGSVAAATDSPRSASGSAVFQHGFASGDPLPTTVLLWTRVTPVPEATPGSGVGPNVTVHYEVATDPEFKCIMSWGSGPTGPERDHTYKVDAIGLTPNTVYYYRFRLGKAVSGVGRTKTAPANDANVQRLRFGVVSCSNWQAGFFAPYRYLAERGDLDAVLHLGDYIYEYKAGEYPNPPQVQPRTHVPAHEVLTLADYRQRHAQYKTDPHLQQLHAVCPWIVTWDDHEVANDAYPDGAENHTPGDGPGGEGDFQARKAAAHQAYFEWMPVRNVGDRLYRRIRFGKLAELSMMDLRSYRSKQVKPETDEADPNRTIAGAEQLNWLIDGVVRSRAQWKLIATPVMFSPLAEPNLPPQMLAVVKQMLGFPVDKKLVYTDQWDGYTADRQKVLGVLRDNKIKDTVFLAGDIHSSWAVDVPLDPATYPAGGTLAVELVCPSVTSDNVDDLFGKPPGVLGPMVSKGIIDKNAHVQWIDYEAHGASVLEVTPQATQMDWYFVGNRAVADTPVTHARSFRVATGTQKVLPATTPIPTGN